MAACIWCQGNGCPTCKGSGQAGRKSAPSVEERIRRALKNQGPCVGQGELARRVFGQGLTLETQEEFNRALRYLLAYPRTRSGLPDLPPNVVEEKRQLPGTGHEGPPVFEYVYTLESLKGQS